MRVDDYHRRCRLKAYAAFDADDCVAHVHVASDAVRSGNRLDVAYRLDFVVKSLSVDSHNLSVLKLDAHLFLAVFLHLLEVCRVGQTLL